MHHHHTDFTRQLALRSRPQVMGRSVAIAADHYLAAEAGMAIARQGGNAVDIAAAIAFCQNVLKPHETSFGGECPVLYYDAKSDTVHSVSGVGRSPAAATPQWFADHRYDLIPGRGFLPAIVPATFGTWTHLLARFGTMSLAQTLTPAWELAHHGFPMYDELHAAISRLAPRKRPRITITPSLALYPKTTAQRGGIAFGMRGGDVQDQITLQFFLAHIALGLPLQQALDVPFHTTESMPNSFYPRDRKPNRLSLQRRLHPDVIASLQTRGHDLFFTDTYKPNPMAVAIDPHTSLRHAGVCSDSGPCYTGAW